jgi:hypothetical protein
MMSIASRSVWAKVYMMDMVPRFCGGGKRSPRTRPSASHHLGILTKRSRPTLKDNLEDIFSSCMETRLALELRRVVDPSHSYCTS